MKKQLLHTPEGVRDIYDLECEQKLLLQNKLFSVMKTYGYHPIETPTFEFFDIFSREIGTIPSKDLYKFFDREGNTLVLRPDFTPSMARSAAKYYMEETMPVRFCYTGNTFINNSSYQGRLKETTQLGAELIGEGSVDADAEMIAMVIRMLLCAGLNKFQVEVGEIEFFKGLLEEAGIDEETEYELRELISIKNYFGVEELLERQSMSPELKTVFLKLPELFGSVEKLNEAKKLTQNKRALLAIERLEKLYELLKVYGLETYVSFDLGMLSKYNYYTGIIFRGYTYGTGEAIVKGGRYDTLLDQFGKHAPAIGFAVVINQLMAALSRQKLLEEPEKSGKLIVYKEGEQAFLFPLAETCRLQGMAVELMKSEEGRTFEDYKTYAKEHHLKSLICTVDEQTAQMYDLEKNETVTASLKKILEV